MLPFLVETYEQGWKLYDESKWLQAQFDKAPAKGFRFLATLEAGFRCMTTRDPLAPRPMPRAKNCEPSRTR